MYSYVMDVTQLQNVNQSRVMTPEWDKLSASMIVAFMIRKSNKNLAIMASETCSYGYSMNI